MSPESPPDHPDRRSFFKEIAAILIGAVSTLVPLVSGLVMFFDPLRKKAKAGDFVLIQMGHNDGG